MLRPIGRHVRPPTSPDTALRHAFFGWPNSPRMSSARQASPRLRRRVPSHLAPPRARGGPRWIRGALALLFCALALVFLMRFSPLGPWLSGKVVAPAAGPFPLGCRWREVHPKQSPPTFWEVRNYEYWHPSASGLMPGRWSRAQPPECRPLAQASRLPAHWPSAGPRTEVTCDQASCHYRNLWYRGGHWYLLVDGEEPQRPWKLTHNHVLQTLHVKSARSFAGNTRHVRVLGNSIFLDFVYFLHPTAIGHWPELLFPLFSVLQTSHADFQADRVVVASLKRDHLFEWARTMLHLALGGKRGASLPPLVWQTETKSVWTQILSSLEGVDPYEWVVFDSLLVVKDAEAGGHRAFQTPELGQAFRAFVYSEYSLPLAAPPRARPSITLLRKSSNRRILNEAPLLEALALLGDVRVAEFEAGTPMEAQLAVVASTDVLVSVHTSALAIAALLRPGSVVLELLQRNWVYMDESFRSQTQSVGDLHHYAWRAVRPEEGRYLDSRDELRFGNWTAADCNTEECVEAHTRVDVVVDVPRVYELLKGRLDLVRAGASVADAEVPWPERGI